jgi:hypothetical protein
MRINSALGCGVGSVRIGGLGFDDDSSLTEID